ncbi:IS30 family transposase [Streptomyces pathocidini]|uniref:IS30 family transposase n=1 Tax=Streptomyces pathocidini TaxID=1650571 RepID=A0ABW7UY06_9ACTN
MAQHQRLSLAADLHVYFAHPHSPWERGTNENTNRLLREYFPKGTDITADPGYLNSVTTELNARPRRTLDYRDTGVSDSETIVSGEEKAIVAPIAKIRAYCSLPCSRITRLDCRRCPSSETRSLLP